VSIASAVRKPNEPLPCPISKITAPPRFQHFLADLPVFLYRRIRKRAEAMRQDVPPAQARKHFEPARGWVVEMRHDWKPGLFCDLERNVEGCHP
jgi:hypothetical protein